MPKKRVKVVVLGDIGRSPRMQYHCLSLSKMGLQVDLIGYGETEPLESIKTDPSILYHYLSPVPTLPIRLVNFLFKTIFQALNLLFLLLITSTCDVVMLQNPPAIPSMAVCYIYAKLAGAKVVIDWHNYAYTIMGLSVGPNHPLVRITELVEKSFGKLSENFCVTQAMQEDLLKRYGIRARTLYDCPPEQFRPITLQEKQSFFAKCSQKYSEIFAKFLTENGASQDRPGLLVSSTSWTQDEDFSLLLAALQEYENHHTDGNARHLPHLICVITGKGPLKQYYLDKISKQQWKNVTILTPWLDPEDYPLILASADLGVSLHTSSSGLDLPMKVVDMFGCGLPVCALNFNCLNELVKNNVNSYVFSSSEELSNLILNWFENFPNNEKQQAVEEKFKTELKTFQRLRWDQNWNKNAAPVFK